MWEDPIVAEIHRTRAKMVEECNFDLDVYFAGLRKRQTETSVERLVPEKLRAVLNEPQPQASVQK